MMFADVILPLALPQLYTYRIPDELKNQVFVGQRVLVQFGKKKIYSSIIAKIHPTEPSVYEAKYILDILDIEPLLDSYQLKLIDWISNYYMCTQGEVINAAIPSGLRLSSESNISLNTIVEISTENIDVREKLIIEELYKKESLAFEDVEKLLGKKNIHKYIKSLLTREYIVLYEQISEKYKPKKTSKIKLQSVFQNELKINELFSILESKPKQSDLLLAFLTESKNDLTAVLDKSFFTSNKRLSASSLNTLIKKEIFEEFWEISSRFPEDKENINFKITLSEKQKEAYDQILKAFSTKSTILFHGITGSGKTEIYIELIKEILNQGQQVLFLIPEIALTTQLVSRLKYHLGDQIGVYHSRYTDNERVEVWEGIAKQRFKVVLGVRGSIFLPFNSLGLIIVDEEHDGSYKQQEPNPRFNARDAAIVLAHFHKAKILLGSATPSLESYSNAMDGNYGFVELKERYGKATLPEIKLIDVLKARNTKSMKGIFSHELLVELKATLARGEQAIFFQNRRGYSPLVSCELCSWTPQCTQCDVSLTLHQYTNELRCHYCGYRTKPTAHCLACGSTKMTSIGYGTEKIEEELQLLLPDAKIDRMDLETTRNKGSFERIISKFEVNETQILVGTQMVTKGLDFDNVTLVCIVNADNMLHFPDFRATERAFQMMIQVSGRAGRREKKGKVLIQTHNPEHTLFKNLLTQDYTSFYLEENNERQSLLYPPKTRLINLTIKHRNQKTTSDFSLALARNLKTKMPIESVLGPAVPYISKIRNMYINELLLKLDKTKQNKAYKLFIQQQIDFLKHSNSDFKYVWVVADVDPN